MDNQLFLLLTARKLSGEASEQDLKELEKFFDKDDLFRKKYELLKAHWDNKNSISTDIDAALQKIMLQIKNQKNTNKEVNPIVTFHKKSGVIKFLLRLSKVAAILILCLAGAYFIYQKTTPDSFGKIASKETFQIQQTPKGGKSTITLSDGTKVILNAETRLKFPQKFSGVTREVYLTGEAFFNVTHNAKMPFIIHTDKMNIKVLGTEFNVKSYPSDSTSETTLIHGLIEVTLKGRPDDRIILKPKEKLIVSNSSTEKTSSEIKTNSQINSVKLLISNLHYISKLDSAVVETSWVDNKLVFQDESFGNLAADMSRKYDVNIQFSNDAIKDYRFTGIFEKETITEALNALQLTEKFNYKVEGTNVNIY
jgi:transmembrane sensor